MRPRLWLAALLGIAAAVLASGGPVMAHRRPQPLEQWGPYSPSEARCQRVLGNAAAQCARRAWELRRACIEPQLAGGQCDTGGTDAAVEEVHQQALDSVDAHCSDVDLVTLQFVGKADAFADVIKGCRDLETALVSGAYGPALQGDGVAAVDDQTRACMHSTALIGGDALRFVSRSHRALLDRFASQPVDGIDKFSSLAQVRLRTRNANAKFAARADAACPDEEFQRVYQHPVTAFVTAISGAVACLTGGVYPQDTVVCGAPTCGNGVAEPFEECDDGNMDDGDRCRSDCTLNQ